MNKSILALTFLIDIERLHYGFFGLFYFFIDISRCFSFSTRKTRYTKERSDELQSKSYMVPKWRHKNNFWRCAPL